MMLPAALLPMTSVNFGEGAQRGAAQRKRTASRAVYRDGIAGRIRHHGDSAASRSRRK